MQAGFADRRSKVSNTRNLKVPTISEEARSAARRAGQFLKAACDVFEGPRAPKLKHVEMLLEQGLREDGEVVEGQFRIEDWEGMEVRQFSQPGRQGHGMIHDTVSNWRLTPKGRAAYEKLKAEALFGLDSKG